MGYLKTLIKCYIGCIMFNREKTIEAIAYIANGLPQQNRTKYYVVKMFYYADKYHLERYGRQVTGDNYIAMKNGPVPSGAYDEIKNVARGSELSNHASNIFSVRGNAINSISSPNLDLFSESEIECFDEAIKVNGSKSFGEIMNETHDEAWHSANENDSISLVAIASMLPNAKELIEHLNDPNPS